MSWYLYSSPRSPFVRKVMIAAYELNLESQIICQDVVTTPMTPAPEVLAVNPMGMIPTLIVDGVAIFDSFVILEFFNEEANGNLFGVAAMRWECLTRHSMANAAIDKAVRMIDEQFRMQNKDTEEHVKGYINAIQRTISWMEPQLSDCRFDAGDICFAALLSYLDIRFPHILWRDGASKANEWFAIVSAKASMKKTAFRLPPTV